MAGIIFWAETKNGELAKVAKETAALARKIADHRNVPVGAVLIHDTNLSGELGRLGSDKIFTFSGDVFTNYSTEGYAGALALAAGEMDADLVITGATALGRDISARVASKLDAALATDITEIQSMDDPMIVIRPMYSGKVQAQVALNHTPCIISLRPNTFPAAEACDRSAEIIPLDLDTMTVRAAVREAIQAAGDLLDVSEADIIVSGGRGMGGPEGFEMLRELARGVGGALGASRVAVDEGWIDYQHQVGQTGKVVSPVLYIACGISGAIQHFAGMGSAKFIIAINSDHDAPIMKKADFAIEGDLYKIVPILKEELLKELN